MRRQAFVVKGVQCLLVYQQVTASGSRFKVLHLTDFGEIGLQERRRLVVLTEDQTFPDKIFPGFNRIDVTVVNPSTVADGQSV